MSTQTASTTDREALLFGFFGTHVDIRHAVDGALASAHGISMATYEVLNQLASAERGGLTLTQLTELAPLSLSRISRLIADLERTGIVERRSCPADRRVSYVALTAKGRTLVRKSQATFFAVVDERFLSQLTPEEAEVLHGVFVRLGHSGGECANALAADTAP